MTWRSPSGGFGLTACAVLLACGLGGEPAMEPAGAATQSPALPSPAQTPARPAATSRRLALLVGINDYTASRLRAPAGTKPPPQDREWPNLGGAVADVEMMRELLLQLYGFAPGDVVTLKDQQATRANVLEAIEERLVKPAGAGDVVLVYYSGHGSQLRNTLSDEPDKLDETLVPADSRLGVADIRDKELRRLFNRILAQGARLTVILDSCHSGSGARGLPTGEQPRGIKPDLRDVADASDAGPRPENHGALVFSAAQDVQSAYEATDEHGDLHGAFSWALARAMRDADADEPAMDVFLRAQARMRAENPAQDPVIAGNPEARQTPFLGAHMLRRRDRTIVAVESVGNDGKVILQGGWAHGLTVGSELRLAGPGGESVKLEVTALRGLGRSEARLVGSSVRTTPPAATGARASYPALQSGSLAEVSGWAAPPGEPLRVWMPSSAGTPGKAVELARELKREAAGKGIRWIEDPTEATPTHLLRWQGKEWELLAPERSAERLGAAPTALAVLAKVPAKSSLFVQLPAPGDLVKSIAVGPGSRREGVQPTQRPEEADYVLVGRLAGGRAEYAWLHPKVEKADQPKTGLPVRTLWRNLETPPGNAEDAPSAALENDVLLLRKIHAWQILESPAGASSLYHLAVRRARDNALVKDVLAANEQYGLMLRAQSAPPPTQAQPRYFYAFAIDSQGKSVLLFPTASGSVENCFPLPCKPGQLVASPPREIPFGPAASFTVGEPFGVDTYFLLSTDEPLPNPWILEWNGVGTRGPRGKTPLEELLSVTGSATRAPIRIVTPTNWSIERVLFQSVPAGARSTR
jgi:uncharacterized caspase-like protein